MEVAIKFLARQNKTRANRQILCASLAGPGIATGWPRPAARFGVSRSRIWRSARMNQIMPRPGTSAAGAVLSFASRLTTKVSGTDRHDRREPDSNPKWGQGTPIHLLRI